jgi:2-dehydro-3-deoxyphosphogluconate aldolase/(4S)-4-hydroxy-2-oxoglutarate aldolase
MPAKVTLERILKGRLVAVLRATSGEKLVGVAEALLAGGIDAIEVTLTIPRAIDVIEQTAKALGDRVLLGAGTVLDPETARAAILAGAQYVVSPTLNLDLIRLCRRYDVMVMPGALTPTEILTAWEAGADVVKVFPSEITGPRYLKALRGPLPQVRLMPTGGVDLTTAEEFLRAGAVALGVGSALVEPKWIENGDWKAIEERARAFVEIVRRTP